MRSTQQRWVLFVCSSVCACAPSDSEWVKSDAGASVHGVRMRSGDQATSLGFEILRTDARGRALECEAAADVSVEVAFDGGPFQPVPADALTISCDSPRPPVVGLVLDNSGSQHDVLEETQRGARGLLDAVLDADGRVGIVRVSTGASVESPVTDDAAALHTAIDELFVNDGWTALYDGLRMGHEIVAHDRLASPSDPSPACGSFPRASLVLFSNGADNNSANEELDLYDDGFATTFDDVANLRIEGAPTPVFSIGLGDDVDRAALERLVSTTGGKHLEVADALAIAEAFDAIAEYGSHSVQVCTDLPALGCGSARVRITLDGTTAQWNVDVPCPVAPVEGRSVTVLLTLSNPGVPEGLARTLSDNAVDWVSPVDGSASVLVVRDDNHHGEFAGDVAFIGELLTDAGHDVTMIDEPTDGLGPAEVEGFDVVWLSNPGWPVDDLASMQALSTHLAHGGGVVLSGDDMSWSFGHGFSMAPWVHLDHQRNGTSTCGRPTDDNAGDRFEVTIADVDHPVVAGIAGATFEYGNDIDHATARNESEVVLARGRLAAAPDCEVSTPVIVAHDP